MHWAWRITGETEIEGQLYFDIERCDETDDGGADCSDPVPIRYDDEHAMLVRRSGETESWWETSDIPCGLDADFGVDPKLGGQPCTGPGAEGMDVRVYVGSYGATHVIPPDTLTGDTYKDFNIYAGTGAGFYAGLGAIAFYYDLMQPTRLVHAIVDGEQVGTPAFATCDPAEAIPGEGIACPDTTDWRRYFPLSVGNQWQYSYSGICNNGVNWCQWGREVVGSEAIDGEEYYLIRRCEKLIDDAIVCDGPVPVRYDEKRRTVAARSDEGQLYAYTAVCDLALPFGSRVERDCLAGSEWFVGGRYSPEGSSKEFGVEGTGFRYAADIGLMEVDGDGSDGLVELAYARVDGVEYGTPIFAFPVSEESKGNAPVTFGLQAVYPNPTRASVSATYTLDRPRAVTLEVTDVLGRVVRVSDEGARPAGPHEVRLATGSLAAGVYVLRLRGDEAEAVRRFVVVR